MQTTILKRDQVEARPVALPDLEDPSSRTGGPAGASGAGASRPARVHPIERDGVVQSIEVHCACGAVTVVDLSYPEPTETGPAPSPR